MSICVTGLRRHSFGSRRESPEAEHQPKPKRQRRQTSIESNLNRRRVRVEHVATREAPFVPMFMHRIHAVAEDRMQPHASRGNSRYLVAQISARILKSERALLTRSPNEPATTNENHQHCGDEDNSLSLSSC